MLLGALLLVCRSSESQQGWSGTKPTLVATGSAPPAELCEFPSSLNRFGNSSSLLLIAQGNTDAEMPHVRAPGSIASAPGDPRHSPATSLAPLTALTAARAAMGGSLPRTTMDPHGQRSAPRTPRTASRARGWRARRAPARTPPTS